MSMSALAKRCAAGLIYVAAVSVPASANDASAASEIENARAILVANNTEKTLDYMFTQLVPVMESGFIGQISQVKGGAGLIEEIETKYPGGQAAFAKRFGELLMARLRAEYPTIIERAAQQYVVEIKADDLAAIRVFMESSAGQSMSAAQPKIQEKLGLIGQEIGKEAGESAAMQLIGEASKYFGNRK